ISGGYGAMEDVNNQRLSFKFKGEWGWKSHNFLGGIETEVMRLDQFGQLKDLGMIFREDINFYTTLLYKADCVGWNIIPGIFLQDSWQIFNQLILNYGLRWDAQLFRGPFKNHNINITDQIQPRIGVIYNPGNSEKYKLTAHFGRYYAQYPLYAAFDKIMPYENSVYAYDTDPRNPGVLPIDTLLVFTSDPPPQVIDPGRLHGEFSDEFVVGFEMLMARNLKFGIKGVYKNLKNGLANYYSGESMIVGNPGSGLLDDLPAFKRKYAALELSLGTYETNRFNFFTSYVLSVNKGNYTGFFDQDNGQVCTPGNYMGLQVAEQIPNCYGYMPNDRRHVFKLNVSYSFKFGLTAGTSFWVMSGTPLNEFGTSPFGLQRYVYLVERGTAGRLPTLWDLNLRLTYDFDIASVHGKIFFDALHVGSPMETVKVDEVKYFDYDRTLENENYGDVVHYQPPMMIRLGINLDI
ncbi:MAG: TonB-dependent receptor domain-containing protein, partial [Bacteroidales bacterium]